MKKTMYNVKENTQQYPLQSVDQHTHTHTHTHTGTIRRIHTHRHTHNTHRNIHTMHTQMHRESSTPYTHIQRH